MDKITLVNLENTEKNNFLSILKYELEKKFKPNNDINYGEDVSWGLISLIKTSSIDSYQLIYVNDKIWVGSGGIIRQFKGKKIYQAGFRAFSLAGNYRTSIGSKSYSHEYNTVYQIKRAKKLGCEELILSFNEYNEKLYKITRDYHLPKIFGSNAFKDSVNMENFNEVPQWLLTMSLT